MTYLSLRLFLRTTRVRRCGDFAGEPPISFLRKSRTRLFVGVAYGGGAFDRAASQSKGIEAERDGDVTGESA